MSPRKLRPEVIRQSPERRREAAAAYLRALTEFLAETEPQPDEEEFHEAVRATLDAASPDGLTTPTALIMVLNQYRARDLSDVVPQNRNAFIQSLRTILRLPTSLRPRIEMGDSA